MPNPHIVNLAQFDPGAIVALAELAANIKNGKLDTNPFSVKAALAAIARRNLPTPNWQALETLSDAEVQDFYRLSCLLDEAANGRISVATTSSHAVSTSDLIAEAIGIDIADSSLTRLKAIFGTPTTSPIRRTPGLVPASFKVPDIGELGTSRPEILQGRSRATAISASFLEQASVGSTYRATNSGGATDLFIRKEKNGKLSLVERGTNDQERVIANDQSAQEINALFYMDQGLKETRATASTTYQTVPVPPNQMFDPAQMATTSSQASTAIYEQPGDAFSDTRDYMKDLRGL